MWNVLPSWQLAEREEKFWLVLCFVLLHFNFLSHSIIPFISFICINIIIGHVRRISNQTHTHIQILSLTRTPNQIWNIYILSLFSIILAIARTVQISPYTPCPLYLLLKITLFYSIPLFSPLSFQIFASLFLLLLLLLFSVSLLAQVLSFSLSLLRQFS